MTAPGQHTRDSQRLIAIALSSELDQDTAQEEVLPDPDMCRLLDGNVRPRAYDRIAADIDAVLGAGALLERSERRKRMAEAADGAVRERASRRQAEYDRAQEQAEEPAEEQRSSRRPRHATAAGAEPTTGPASDDDAAGLAPGGSMLDRALRRLAWRDPDNTR